MPIPGGSRATRKLSFVGRISIDKRASSDRPIAGEKPTSHYQFAQTSHNPVSGPDVGMCSVPYGTITRPPAVTCRVLPLTVFQSGEYRQQRRQRSAK
jgi:hypothetical protein